MEELQVPQVSKDTNVFVDRHGNEIRAGDFIVYANATGRSSKTAVGQIEVVAFVHSQSWNEDSPMVPQLRVLSVQDDTWAHGMPYAKSVTLSVTERVLKYSP